MKAKGRRALTMGLAAVIAGGSLNVPINVLAEEVSITDFTSTSEVECGYDRIYRDVPGSTWIMQRPDKPAEQSLTVSFEASEGEQYSFRLMDSTQTTEIAKVEGTATEGINEVALKLPGDTPDGEYKIVGSVGESQPSVKDVTVNGNIALEAETEISCNYEGAATANLKDLTINPLEAKGNPSTNPVEITYEFNKKSAVTAIDVFTSNVGKQDPTEIELYAKNEAGEYDKVATYNTFSWESYVNGEGEDAKLGEPRKRARLSLPNTIETDSIMLKTTKGNQAWNKVVFDEVMVWGHETSDSYQLELKETVGTANTKNAITIEGTAAGDHANSAVTAKLLKGEEVLTEVTGQFTDGMLSLVLETPENIAAGEYTVEVTSEDGISKTFNYSVQLGITYETNIDDQISAYTSNYTEFKVLKNINDGEYSASQTVKSVKLWTKDVETDESFAARSIKVYADKDSFSNVTMNVGTADNTNTAFTKALDFNNLEWKTDDKGSYVELFINYNFLSYGYELVFEKDAPIKEVDVTGVYFKNNLFDDATITYNGKKLNARGMTDNSIITDTAFTQGSGQGKQEIVISSDDGQAYSIDNYK